MRRVQIFVLLTSLPLLMSCSKDETEEKKPEPSTVGQKCGEASDAPCSSSEKCVWGVCRAGCSTDAECSSGALCLGDKAPFVCAVPAEESCAEGTDECPAPLVCGIDAKCRTSCDDETPCPRADHLCLSGTCVGKAEPDAGSSWLSCGDGRGDAGPFVSEAVRCDVGRSPKLMVCNSTVAGWAEAKSCNCANLKGLGEDLPWGAWCQCDKLAEGDRSTQVKNAVIACLANSVCNECLTTAYTPSCDSLPLYGAIRKANCSEQGTELTCAQCAAVQGISCENPSGWTTEQCLACLHEDKPAENACAPYAEVPHMAQVCDVCEQCNSQCAQLGK